jgi:hypothetical protein
MYIITGRHPEVYKGAEFTVEWPIEPTLEAVAKAIYEGQIKDIERVLQLGVAEEDGICEYDMTSEAAWLVAAMSLEEGKPLTGFAAKFCDRFVTAYHTMDDSERDEREAHQDHMQASKDYRGSVL